VPREASCTGVDSIQGPHVASAAITRVEQLKPLQDVSPGALQGVHPKGWCHLMNEWDVWMSK
jgi:hypothetical protein